MAPRAAMARRGRRPPSSASARLLPRAAALASLAAAAGAAAAALADAFVAGLGVSRGAAGGPLQRSLVAASATATVAPIMTAPDVKRKLAMMSDVDSKLKLLYQTPEYAQVLDVLRKLEDAGKLENFLERAALYWSEANIREWGSREASMGRTVTTNMKRDWPTIWPEGMDEDRMKAFQVFSLFWKRLDASRVFDMVVNELVPSLSTDGKKGSWQADLDMRMLTMSDEDLNRFFEARMQASPVINQIRMLTMDDGEDVHRLGNKIKPFISKVLAQFHEKIVTKSDHDIPEIYNYGVFLGLFLAFLGILGFLGLLPNSPFAEEELPMNRSTPMFATTAAEEAKMFKNSQNKAEAAAKILEAQTARQLGKAPAPTMEAPAAYE